MRLPEMMDHRGRGALRGWVAGRAATFGQASTGLLLVLPFMQLALLRYLRDVDLSGWTGLYAALVLVGYYGLGTYVLLAAVFLVLAPWHRATLVATGTLITGVLLYLVVDGATYPVYRYHIDAFFLRLAFSSLAGIGITWRIALMVLGAALGAIALVWFLFRLAGRLRRRRRLAVATFALFLVAFAASQAMHIVAYAKNDTRLTQISPRLPLYHPFHSYRNAQRYAGLLPMIRETAADAPAGGAEAGGEQRSLAYPLRPVAGEALRRPNILLLLLESWRADAMDSLVSPQMDRFARRSTRFNRHFSSGNSTPSGVFSLFYGIHPTYWSAVKANAASIDNPVLIDVLQANGYALGIFADSHFERHKIQDTIFRGIPVVEDFAGRTADLKDADLTEQLGDFALQAHAEGRPFFGFAFYKSTHFSYWHPEDAAPFQPERDFDFTRRVAEQNRAEVLNDYRNAVHYTDGLIGSLLDRLEAAGILDSTIVVITGDHGEEFNDGGAGYWGHTGNFTGYQTRVPMILHLPGRPPGVVEAVTAHVDLPGTLLVEGLGCAPDVAAYSNGRNLLGPLPAERPIVVASYVNHALVFGEDVFVINPLRVQRHKLWDIAAEGGELDPARARLAMEEMGRFYRAGAQAH